MKELDGMEVRLELFEFKNICMDMAMADVSALPELQTGDVAEVFGVHLPVEEQAAKCETICYELLCAVSPRVPRLYLDGQGACGQEPIPRAGV